MAKPDEVVATAAALLEEQEKAKKEKKPGFLQRVGGLDGLLGTVKNTTSNINEFYANWVKPIYDNRMQISRRLNTLSLIYSILFFIFYIPFLLFGKIADGLSLGREIALYVCLGTYIVALIVLLIVYITLGKSQSTATSGHYKKTLKIFLYVVRIASVAISITALVITTSSSNEASPLTTLGIVFAIVSIVSSALPLLFGGIKGFLKWLISPVKVQYKVSFVALEWFECAKDENSNKKGRLNKKYFETVAQCVDNIIVPKLGNKVAKTVTREQIAALVDATEEKDKELTLFVLNKIFEYALRCGYIPSNPCDELDIPDELPTEKKTQKKGLLARLFRRENSDETEE